MKRCYVTTEQVGEVLKKLQAFEASLYKTFDNFGYDLNDNLGRKNALLSQAQEKELAKVLKKEYGGDEVVVDGRPGQPDIIIKCLKKELECKLTSGHGKNKTFDLQTDYETLKRKGSLDYLYMLASPSFTKFCVLFFEGLTIADFHPPATGSRGKARMKKPNAMKKVKVLWGKSQNINIRMKKKWNSRLSTLVDEKTKRIGELNYRLKTTPSGAAQEQGKLATLIRREEERYDKKIDAIIEKVEYWDKANERFSFLLEKA